MYIIFLHLYLKHQSHIQLILNSNMAATVTYIFLSEQVLNECLHSAYFNTPSKWFVFNIF